MAREQKLSIIQQILQNRLALLIILFCIQGMFFAINLTNSVVREPTDGWELKIDAVDNHLEPMPIWLIPYGIANVFAVTIPLWASFFMPNRIYRQYLLAMAFAALVSYAIYLVIPTYVTKPALSEVEGNGILSQMLRDVYEADNAYSTHNAAPSQHVFYILLSMCFMIRFRPRARVFWFWVTMAALVSASALLTRQHHSPDLIAGYLMAVIAYPVGLALGSRLTDRLGDADANYLTPLGQLRQLRQTQRRRFRTHADSV